MRGWLKNARRALYDKRLSWLLVVTVTGIFVGQMLMIVGLWVVGLGMNKQLRGVTVPQG